MKEPPFFRSFRHCFLTLPIFLPLYDSYGLFQASLQPFAAVFQLDWSRLAKDPAQRSQFKLRRQWKKCVGQQHLVWFCVDQLLARNDFQQDGQVWTEGSHQPRQDKPQPPGVDRVTRHVGERLSSDFLAQIFFTLKKAGLIRSVGVRGADLC